MSTARQLEVAVWRDGGSSVVCLRGDLDMHTAGDLREVLRELISAGHDDILLDLSDLGFIDSAGLGVLIGGLRRTRAQGGSLALAAPRPGVRRVLDLGGLSGVFTIRPAPPRQPGHANWRQ